MEDEETDDFGDLYADLDSHLSFGLASIPGFYALSVGDEFKGNPKPTKANSIAGEYTPLCGTSEAGGHAKELPILEAQEDRDSSDSDDGLRIVLNEGDYPEFPPASQRVDLGGYEEDEEDDLVIVADGASGDRRRAEKLPVPDCGGTRGGGTVKSRTWYVGSNSTAYPRNAKTSIFGKGDWDQLQIKQPGASASCNLGILTLEQNAFCFCLPRSRTIFDVSIESFERKPWRRHGADITDFFNFGLDEEGWKSYCKSLDLYRQKVAKPVGFPDYDSSRPNQGKIGSSVLENMKKRGRAFEMLKGRAIQVEGGEGERMPSMDIRRPRYRDSDVVIQITMEDSMKDESIPSKNEEEHRYTDGMIQKSQNKVNDGLPPLSHDGPEIGEEPVNHHHSEENEIVSVGTSVEAKAEVCKRGDVVNSSRTDVSNLEGESTFGAHIFDISSSSHKESQSEASSNGVSSENLLKPAKSILTSSGFGFKESSMSGNYFLNISKRNTIGTEEEDDQDHNHNCNCPVGSHGSCRRTRDQSVDEQNVSFNEEHMFSQADREFQNDADYCGTTNMGNNYVFNGGGLFSCRGSDRATYYRSRRYSENPAYENSCAKFSCTNGYQNKYPRIDWDENQFFFKRRFRAGENEIRQREHYFLARDHDDRAMRDVTPEDSSLSISADQYLLKEKDAHLWWKVKREDCRSRMETVNDEKFTKDGYREGFVQEMHGRHITYKSREEEIFDCKFTRQVPHIPRVRNLEKRDKYEQSSFFDLDWPNIYVENDDKDWKHLKHSLLVSHTCKETRIAYERDGRDASLLRHDSLMSCRTSKRPVDHKKDPNIKGIPSKVKKDGYSNPRNKVPYCSYHDDCPNFEDDNHIAEERVYYDNIACSAKRSYSWLAKPRPGIDDEDSVRHKKLGDLTSPKVSSSLERCSRHDKSFVDHNRLSGQKFSDDHLDRKAIPAEEYANFSVRDHGSSVSNNFEKDMHEAFVECREAVNKHLSCWKGKFPRRCNKVTGRSDTRRNPEPRIDKLMKGSIHVEEPYKRKEVSSHMLKMEGVHVGPIRLKVEGSREGKSEQSNDHILKNFHEKHPKTRNHEDDELEEGELVEEPHRQEVISVKKRLDVENEVAYGVIELSGSNCLEENHIRSEDSARNSKVTRGYDNNRILEALAKMKKRRERFKEPIAPKEEDPEKSLNPQVGVVVMDEIKQLRPARKRRWGGS